MDYAPSPPQIVPGSHVTHAGGRVSTSTLPFLSHHPMPPIPASTPPLSRSASPAVINSSMTAGPSAAGTHSLGAADRLRHQQQGNSAPIANESVAAKKQDRPQSVNRTWTNLKPAGAVKSTAGWLANLTGVGKFGQGPSS